MSVTPLNASRASSPNMAKPPRTQALPYPRKTVTGRATTMSGTGSGAAALASSTSRCAATSAASVVPRGALQRQHTSSRGRLSFQQTLQTHCSPTVTLGFSLFRCGTSANRLRPVARSASATLAPDVQAP